LRYLIGGLSLSDQDNSKALADPFIFGYPQTLAG
jgi:hypothetical protein